MYRSVALVLVVALANLARAELPSPRLDRIHPAGLVAGNSVEILVQGNDLEECQSLVLGHPGLKAEFVKAEEGNRLRFKLTAAGDVPTGTYDLWASGRFGITNPRPLQIVRGLADVAETEPNNALATAQTVALNSAVSGEADGNNQDLFKVALKQGQRVTLDCWSARLETEMDPMLSVFSAGGQQLASNSDYVGRDPLIDFLVPADGEYFVEVRDLTYRGGYPYRLLIHDEPRVENVFPRAATAGQTLTLTALGSNLNKSAPASKLKLFDLPQQEWNLPYTPLPDIQAQGLFRFRVHPLQHSVLPTAATCTLIGEQILPLEADPVVMVVTDGPTGVEQEPNDTKEQPQALALPAMVSGRFDQPRDADWYVFETAEKGSEYGFDVYAERIAGRCDPYLAIYDDQGNRVQELDDYGHRMNAFDGHLRDPSGTVNLQPKKKYRLLVQDRYQRGGPRYQYVLNVREARSDFYAASIPSNNQLAGTTVWQGAAAYLDVVLHHVDGGNQYPTTITAEGLPPGLHVTPTTITSDIRGSVVFWSDDSAAPFTGNIRLTAVSKHGDRELRREVRPYTRAYQQQGSRPLREQPVAIRERAPYALRIEPERISVVAGQKADVKLIVTRYWSDFQDSVNFQSLNWPGQFQLGNGTISAGQSEATLSIQVQNGTREGDYTLTVQGQAQVPFHKNREEKNRPKTLVSLPSRPVTISVTKPEK